MKPWPSCSLAENPPRALSFPRFGKPSRTSKFAGKSASHGGAQIPLVPTTIWLNVHFVIEDIHEKGKLDETRRVFQVLEKVLVEGDQEIKDLIGPGFFETLQNVASHQPQGNRPYEQFFGPRSKEIWSELQKMWAGKSSLMDVIRAEQKPNNPR